MKKYVILDFGNVLAYATTGYWFITPCLLNTINMDLLDQNTLFKEATTYNAILSRKAINLDDEYQLFYDYYVDIFKKVNYPITEKELKKIVDNIVYSDDKYTFYDNVHRELELLSGKYTLLLLSDNWPCAIRVMKNADIYKYFDKLYISSIYGYDKKDGVLFDYPINDYHLQRGDAIFVDDKAELLDIASSKGLDTRLMNREKKKIKCKHQVITNLMDLL